MPVAFTTNVELVVPSSHKYVYWGWGGGGLFRLEIVICPTGLPGQNPTGLLLNKTGSGELSKTGKEVDVEQSPLTTVKV